MVLLGYPKCSTSIKAKKFLEAAGIAFIWRDITVDNPSREELVLWMEKAGLPRKKFFNTSGLVYKEMGLSQKLPTMTEEEMLSLLASNGRLVKRPILVADGFVLVGFKEEIWKEKLQ